IIVITSLTTFSSRPFAWGWNASLKYMNLLGYLHRDARDAVAELALRLPSYSSPLVGPQGGGIRKTRSHFATTSVTSADSSSSSGPPALDAKSNLINRL